MVSASVFVVVVVAAAASVSHLATFRALIRESIVEQILFLLANSCRRFGGFVDLDLDGAGFVLVFSIVLLSLLLLLLLEVDVEIQVNRKISKIISNDTWN